MKRYSFSKLKQKQIRLSASFGKRRLFYFIAALIASLLVLAGTFLDESLGWRIIAVFVKFSLAFLAFVLAKQSGYLDPAGDKSLVSPYLILALVPVVFSAVAWLGPFSGPVDYLSVAVGLLGTLGTALWEELYFRLWGRILFEENGKYRAFDFLFIALTFGSMHLINLIAAPAGTVLIQAMLAVLTGLFLQSLYSASGSLRLVILFHFLMNAVNSLFGSWLTDPEAGRFFPALTAAAPLILGAFYALSAAILTRRAHLLITPPSLFRRKKDAGKR